MTSIEELAPSLTAESEPWVGTFPGVGSIAVRFDGSYDVHVDPRTNDAEGARMALEFGWAEPLSFVRQGFQLAGATTLVEPEQDPSGHRERRGLLLGGREPAVTELALALALKGWTLVADTLTPLTFGSFVRAHPRSGPWIAPRHLTQPSTLVHDVRLRPGATAQLVQAPRWTDPVRISARVTVAVDDLHDLTDFVRPVQGSARMGPEHHILTTPQVAGVQPEDTMRFDIALTSLPMAEVCWSTLPDILAGRAPRLLESLQSWWQDQAR